MNDDHLLLLFSFILYWVTFTFLLIKIKDKKQGLVINLSIHVIYSSYFLYGLFYRSQGNGTALAWWFYLLVLLWTHWLINLGQLVYLLIKSRSRN
jgi:hypothetical protein